MPQGAKLSRLQVQDQGKSQLLLAMESQTNGSKVRSAKPKPALFFIKGEQSSAASIGDLQKQFSKLGFGDIVQRQLGGRDFYRGELRQSNATGKLQIIEYATFDGEYVLRFMISSYDRKLTKEWEHSIQLVSFFDPGKAREMAGVDARPYRGPSFIAEPAPESVGKLDMGVLNGQTYSNAMLGFSFVFPAGWDLQDEKTQQDTLEAGHEFIYGNNAAARTEHDRLLQCSRVLLWVKKPSRSASQEIASSIVIAAIDGSCVPGTVLPKSLNDEQGIRQLAQQLRNSFAAPPVLGGVYTARAFWLQDHVMLDISGNGTMSLSDNSSPVPWCESMIITQIGKFWVDFVFVSNTQADVDRLRDLVKIEFAPDPRFAESKR